MFVLGNAHAFIWLLLLLIEFVVDFLSKRSLLLFLLLCTKILGVAALALSRRLLLLRDLLEWACGISYFFLCICHFGLLFCC